MVFLKKKEFGRSDSVKDGKNRGEQRIRKKSKREREREKLMKKSIAKKTL